jgi:hypothetical protein
VHATPRAAARVRGDSVEDILSKVVTFCQIQLAIVTEKESSLRKELLECKIQKEFLIHTIGEVKGSPTKERKK